MHLAVLVGRLAAPDTTRSLAIALLLLRSRGRLASTSRPPNPITCIVESPRVTVAVALIVAAGRGERLGTDRPKALVSLGGRPMLEWSLDALRAVDAVHEIIVALPGDWLHAAPRV